MLKILIFLAPALVFRLIPLSIGIFYWRRYFKSEKAFILLMAYDIIGVLIGGVLILLYRSNIIMTNIYIIVEVFLLSIFFQQFINNELSKKILKWFPLIFGLLVAFTSLSIFGIHNNNPIGNGIESLFCVALGVIALGSIVSKDNSYIRQGLFWISLSLFLYYILNMGYLSLRYWFINSDFLENEFLYTVLNYSFNVSNVMFAIGLWLIARERSRTLN